MNTSHLRLLLTLGLTSIIGLTGCAGVNTFTTAVRAGDTVALPIGWNKGISRQNLTVTITTSTGSQIVYNPGDPALRAVVNMYPDAVSRLVVGYETQQDLGYNALGYGNLVYGLATNQDRDWYETTLLLDLPPPAQLPPGVATITLSTPAGPVMYTSNPWTHAQAPISLSVNILSGTGSPNTFQAAEGVTIGAGTPPPLQTLERADAYTMSLQGTTVPYAVQMTLTHASNVGKAWVANARGDIRNITWTDDGTNLTVMIAPAAGQQLANLSDFKFYVAGGLANLVLQPGSFRAYDMAGNLIGGITPLIQQ